MWRVFLGLMTMVFALGAASGLVVTTFLLVETDYRNAGFVGGAAAFMLWGAFACRREWIRENQRAAFEAENREPPSAG